MSTIDLRPVKLMFKTLLEALEWKMTQVDYGLAAHFSLTQTITPANSDEQESKTCDLLSNNLMNTRNSNVCLGRALDNLYFLHAL